MNKRGFETTLLVGLITAIISMIVIGGAYFNIEKIVREAGDITICKDTILATAYKVGGVRVLSDEIKIKKNCPPDLVYFESKATPDFIKETIADDIKTCWDKFGSAKVDFMPNYEGKNPVMCLPCNVYRSEIKRDINSGNIINLFLTENKQVKKTSTNFAIDTINVGIINNNKFSDEEKKNDFYIKERGIVYPGLYMIYIASKDIDVITKDYCYNEQNKLVDVYRSNSIYRSKIQSNIQGNKKLYKISQNKQILTKSKSEFPKCDNLFYNPRGNKNDNFASIILITDDYEKIKEYCDNKFNQISFPLE